MNLKLKISHSDLMIHKWLKHIQRVHSEEEAIIKNGSKFFIPFVAISTPIVKMVFMMVKKFQLSSKTKYIALCIYDKFMCNQFWELYTQYGNNPDSKQYKNATAQMLNVARLRLMSCIQLASKMDCHSSGLGISQVIYGLNLMDSFSNEKHEYTPKMIFHSEYKVFKMIDFKIPIVTSADAVEVLLAAMHLQEIPKLHETAMTILDFTYLQHQQLYCQLQFMVTGTIAKTKAEKLNVMTMESDILFLSSGIVLCTLFIFNLRNSVLKDIEKRLSELVRIEDSDISTMAHMIFTMLGLPITL